MKYYVQAQEIMKEQLLELFHFAVIHRMLGGYRSA